MLHRRRRLVARFLAVGLLAATLLAVDSLASPSPADARCKGEGHPAYSWWIWSPDDGIAVSETAQVDTCNGNNIYTGILMDEAADGFCVSVEFMEAGYDWQRPPGMGVLCGNGNTQRFQWQDINGNSTAYERLCVHRASDHFQVSCGWGDIGAPDYATNWGY